MRNISFALTTDQVRNQTKTVTRRIGWAWLKPGTLLQPIVKGQGIPKGGKVEKIGAPIRVVSVRRERLSKLVSSSPAWARREVVAEGFPEMTAYQFFGFFSKSHGARSEDQALRLEVTRIEFEYTEASR
jgi:hypothetical protein